MNLYAISDLHLGHRSNRDALKALPIHPSDWLILAGDVGETEAHLEFALHYLTQQFQKIVWTPGNHDLWTLPSDKAGSRGEARYRRLVDICRKHGVLTPEDPYTPWPPANPMCVLAPVFVLYDYSFRPDHVELSKAIEWAAESGIVSSDEELLYTEPYPSATVWCTLRARYTEKRLAATPTTHPLVLINHFPLRYDLAHLRRIPRFSLWCGTRRTEDWHTRFHVRAVIYGHLHVRGTHMIDNVRFEEVSLGYPKQWNPHLGIQGYLRRILTAPD